MNITQALLKLAPGAEWVNTDNDYNQLQWLSPDIPKPSKSQVEAKIKELQKEWEDTQYQRDRAPQYPSLADFVDAYYWAQKGDNTKMNAYIAQCDEVKNQYPKP
jgi:hypothetical protein